MSQTVCTIGIDPGPTPGLVLLRYRQNSLGWRPPEVTVVQCTTDVAPVFLVQLLNLAGEDLACVQAERFVVRQRAGKSGSAAAGERTRKLLGQLFAAMPLHQASHWHERSAAEVKPWATDRRLEAAGLAHPTLGMRHARDAARHALFAAVHDGALPDPLSKRGTS